jgi:hypothetical protein
MIERPQRATESREKTLKRAALQKAFFLKGFFHEGAYPATEQAAGLMTNPLIIAENTGSLKQPNSETGQRLKEYLSPTNQPDRFTIQDEGAALARTVLENVPEPDMIDVLCATKAVNIALLNTVKENVPDSQVPRVVQRFQDLRASYLQELVQAVPLNRLLGEGELDLEQVANNIFPDGATGIPMTELKSIIRDRIILGEVIIEGGFSQLLPNSDTPYGRPLPEEERTRMNNVAADTIEGIHLLKRYGVTSFDIPGSKVGLPWDIAVVPPLDIQTSPTDKETLPKYAEGAIVDILFLPPNPERSDIRLHSHEETSPDGKRAITHISAGDSEAKMRFRLHDNGQITSGMFYHNVPSDLTEKMFQQSGALDAFQRIRGEIIALGSDATLPEEVTSGDEVRGSVAREYKRIKATTPEKRITELLLRRRKALRKAKVTPEHPKPEGWVAPQSKVHGYVKTLPEETRARPTANAEATAYFASINVPFNGLQEGETFVNPHQRGTDLAPQRYHRARFRKTAATTIFLNELNKPH